MPSISYVFLRGLELESRHPHDVGGWQVTVRRMEVGEGVPLETDPAHMVEFQEGQPYPPAPKLPQHRRVRFFYYRRIRSVAECERYIQIVCPEVPVCLDLFPSWGNPPNGVIPMPKEGEKRLDTSHLVVLCNFSAERREFLFRNTWGEKWGARGYGTLPYDYFDNYVFESWVTYLGKLVNLESRKVTHAAGRRDLRWVVRDEWRRRVYGFEVLDEQRDERMAWSFVIERDGALEIEELYVRPEFRARGYGKVLAGKVRDLAIAKRLPIRLWVPFADTRQEHEANYPALTALARVLGVQFQPCPVVWAAYFATDERPGALSPVEPTRIPPRPMSTLEAVLAMAMAFGPGPADNGTPQTPAAVREDASFPEPGTEAWSVMNRRRAELIRKKVRQELSPEELPEYERLQRLSEAALDRVFPASTVGDEELARIEARLRDKSGESLK